MPIDALAFKVFPRRSCEVCNGALTGLSKEKRHGVEEKARCWEEEITQDKD
jgi:hypothetical protein